MTRLEFIKSLVAQGISSEQIAIRVVLFEETLAQEIKHENALAYRAEKSKEYYAHKEAVNNRCKTCGCLIAHNSESGYCRKHVAKAILSIEPEKRAKPVKVKYKSITFYGVKGEDLMEHRNRYYQGGACSHR